MNTHINILVLSDNSVDLQQNLNCTLDKKLLVYNLNMDFSNGVVSDTRQASVHLWLHGINARRYFMIGHIDYIFYCVQNVEQYIHLLKYRESLKCLNNIQEFIITDKVSNFQAIDDKPCYHITKILSIIQELTTKMIYHRIKQLSINI